MDDIAGRGVGLIMQRNVTKSVKCFDPISRKVMQMDLMTDRSVVSVVVGFASTEQSEGEMKDYYTNIIARLGNADWIFGDCLGDFNAKIGQK